MVELRLVRRFMLDPNLHLVSRQVSLFTAESTSWNEQTPIRTRGIQIPTKRASVPRNKPNYGRRDIDEIRVECAAT